MSDTKVEYDTEIEVDFLSDSEPEQNQREASHAAVPLPDNVSEQKKGVNKPVSKKGKKSRSRRSRRRVYESSEDDSESESSEEEYVRRKRRSKAKHAKKETEMLNMMREMKLTIDSLRRKPVSTPPPVEEPVFKDTPPKKNRFVYY